MEALQDAVAKLESSNDDVVYEINDDAGFKADVEQHADFMFRAERARMGAVSALATLEGATAKPSVQASSAAPGPTISLPKLKLPKFGGDVVEWSSHREPADSTTLLRVIYWRNVLGGRSASSLRIYRPFSQFAAHENIKDGPPSSPF